MFTPFAAAILQTVSLPSSSLTEPGSVWGGFPIAALAISQRTMGEFLDAANLVRLDSFLSRLTRLLTLFLTCLYLGPRPSKSLRSKVSGLRYRRSAPSLTVILLIGATQGPCCVRSPR
jgi:hypothetical protein